MPVHAPSALERKPRPALPTPPDLHTKLGEAAASSSEQVCTLQARLEELGTELNACRQAEEQVRQEMAAAATAAAGVETELRETKAGLEAERACASEHKQAFEDGQACLQRTVAELEVSLGCSCGRGGRGCVGLQMAAWCLWSWLHAPVPRAWITKHAC